MSPPPSVTMVFPPPSLSVGSPSLYKEKLEIAHNLSGKIVEGGPATSMYLDIATNTEIHNYLKDTSFYNTRKKRGQTWRARMVLAQIMQQIMRTLGQSGDCREAIDNFGTPLKHFGTSGLESMPSIVIKAKGPSFGVPDDEDLGFTNIASFVAFQSNSLNLSLADQFYEVAVPAKQILAHQPNRRFVPCLFMTETAFSLAHFDCAGAYYTKPINYHKHPMAFVRAILGLSTQDERLLGFDTTIRWSHDDQGRKAEGTIGVKEVLEGEERTTVYRNIQLRVREHEEFIVGRGTTCWIVEDPETGERLFLKDQFRREGCQAEGDFLALAKGIPGVVQAVASEPSRENISDMRSAGPGTGACILAKKDNMIQSRLVMKMCGKPIDEFDSEKELIAALRDAIAAHRHLFRYCDILHRDISFNNILFGVKSATKGWRGNLIDFDMSIFKEKLTQLSIPCGTPTFQSVNVLRSYNPQHKLLVALHHDHHDDLQAFFYLLLLIVWTMDGPHQPTDFNISSQALAFVDAFDDENLDAAADYKYQMFCEDKLDLQNVSGYWSQPTKQLLRRVFEVLKPDVLWKEGLRRVPGCLEKQKAEQRNKMETESDELYKQILKFFDEALDSMEKAEERARAKVMDVLRVRKTNIEVVSPPNRKRKMQGDTEEHEDAEVDVGVEDKDAKDENEEPVETATKRARRV